VLITKVEEKQLLQIPRYMQCCAKVMQANFDKHPSFTWLFKEISFEKIFSAIFATNFCSLIG